MTEAGGVGKTKITSEDVHGCHVHITTCFLYNNTDVFAPLPAEIAAVWVILARDSTCGNKTWQKKLMIALKLPKHGKITIIFRNGQKTKTTKI